MRKRKIVYTFDNNGVFTGNDIAWESLNFDGTYILPANSTEVAPKKIIEGYFSKWNGSEWELESIPKPEPIPEPEPEPPITWDQIRSQRNYFLKESDWIDLPNSPVKNKEAWLTYRQALRNLPQNFSEPSEIVWPTKPE